jgi:hypothetical protein
MSDKKSYETDVGEATSQQDDVWKWGMIDEFEEKTKDWTREGFERDVWGQVRKSISLTMVEHFCLGYADNITRVSLIGFDPDFSPDIEYEDEMAGRVRELVETKGDSGKAHKRRNDKSEQSEGAKKRTKMGDSGKDGNESDKENTPP